MNGIKIIQIFDKKLKIDFCVYIEVNYLKYLVMMIKRRHWLTIEYNFVILDSFYVASDLKISEFTRSFQ